MILSSPVLEESPNQYSPKLQKLPPIFFSVL